MQCSKSDHSFSLAQYLKIVPYLVRDGRVATHPKSKYDHLPNVLCERYIRAHTPVVFDTPVESAEFHLFMCPAVYKIKIYL